MGALILRETLERMGRVWGQTLTVIYSAECVAARTTRRPVAILPLLVILFVVSYGILTMLVFEQGQTIESQRSLIREMLKDSTQLASLKRKLAETTASGCTTKRQCRRIRKTPIRALLRQEQKDRTKKLNDPVSRHAPRRKFPGSRPRI